MSASDLIERTGDDVEPTISVPSAGGFYVQPNFGEIHNGKSLFIGPWDGDYVTPDEAIAMGMALIEMANRQKRMGHE